MCSRTGASSGWEEFSAGHPPGSAAFWVRRVAFVRFDENGSVDASFGHAGWVDGPDSSESFNAWAALPDGHIVALTARYDGPGRPGTSWLHRFTADGAVDREFGQDGSVRLGVNALDAWNELLPARDGSLVLLGTVGGDHPAGFATAVRRIWPGGRLDARFGTACGRRWLPGFSLGGAALTRNGGVFVAGSTYITQRRTDSLFVRYDAQGCVADRPLRIRAISAGPPCCRGVV